MDDFEPPAPRTEQTLKWIAVDFDGTLCETQMPNFQMGPPMEGARDKVNQIYLKGYKVIVHTARHWSDYEAIEKWMEHYDIPFSRIVCGKPLAKLYVDDKARHAESENWLP